MSTANMVRDWDHDFVLTAEMVSRVVAQIREDRTLGRLRSAEPSGLSDDEALAEFASGCALLRQATPKLVAGGSARRGSAKENLFGLLNHLAALRSAIEGMQLSIGDDTYSEMPDGALSALIRAAPESEPPCERGISSFADFLPDPLGWQDKGASLSVYADWAAGLEPLLKRAIATLDQPGRSQGSAARMAGGRILHLLRGLDREEQKPARRPSRRHLADWLQMMFDAVGVAPPKNMEVLAKNVLADVFSKDRADWRHPERSAPKYPRDILICTVGADGVLHWSGALVDRDGQRPLRK